MTGTLGLFSLVDLFQLIAASARTGRLNIHREDGQAKIYFDKGRVVHAELNDIIGNEAVYALFADERGSFDFQVGVTTTHRSVTLSTENLVLEGIRRLDEAKATEAPEPALDRVPVFIDNAFDVSKLTLQSHELQVLSRIDGRSTVGEIAEQLALSPHEVSRVLERLMRLGVLKLRLRKPRTARLVVSVTRQLRLASGVAAIAPGILASWQKVLGHAPEQIICRKPNGELVAFAVTPAEEAGPYLLVSPETMLRANLVANMPLLVKPLLPDSERAS